MRRFRRRTWWTAGALTLVAAALNLEDTHVRAPVAGQITARRIVAGQQVRGGQAA